MVALTDATRTPNTEALRAALTRAALLAFRRRCIAVRWGASHRYEVMERGMRWEVEGPRCKPLAIMSRDGWKRAEPCEAWPCAHFGATLLPHGYRANANHGPDIRMLPFSEECPGAHFNHACYFCWHGMEHTFGEHAVEIAYHQGRVMTGAGEETPWLSHHIEGVEAEESHRMAARLAISAVEAAL